MATIVKEEVPTGVRREIPGIRRRGLPWPWLLAVVVALAIGLVAGAAGWQATRSDATAATTKLAQRYIAAGMWTPGQAAMFAANGKWVVVPEGMFGYGHPNSVVPKAVRSDPMYYSTIEASMAAHKNAPEVQATAKESLVFAGPNGFVIAWTAKGYSSVTGKHFNVPGVSVSTVQNGKITLQKVYFDPNPILGPQQ